MYCANPSASTPIDTTFFGSSSNALRLLAVATTLVPKPSAFVQRNEAEHAGHDAQSFVINTAGYDSNDTVDTTKYVMGI